MNSNEILSTEELSALMPEPPKSDGTEREKRKRIVPYNFRRPDRLSKDQVRSLYLLHDLFAHSLSTSLPLFLRTIAEVNLISVEQQAYSEYLRGLPDPTTVFTISSASLNGVFAIEINSSIAFPIIDRLLGGTGAELSEKRAATDLELKILEGFLTIVTENYRNAWNPILPIETEVVGRETRPQMLQIIAPNEVVATIGYQVQIGETMGAMSICLPVVMLENVIEKFNQSSYLPAKATAPEATRCLLESLSKVRLPFSTELDSVPAAVLDLMNLSVGDVVRTNHRTDRPLSVSVGDTVKFVGKIASLEGRMIVQVTDRGNKKLSN
ncbi:MAG: flagellar motor switch protein FliM [Pyrinomonadaceae bacterium]|nr:flagellar motor switch protein FliM [Pyrinomonadaceae bacterium]